MSVKVDQNLSPSYVGQPISQEKFENYRKELKEVVLPYLPALNDAFSKIAEGQAMLAESQYKLAKAQAVLSKEQVVLAKEQTVLEKGQLMLAEGQVMYIEGQANFIEDQAKLAKNQEKLTGEQQRFAAAQAKIEIANKMSANADLKMQANDVRRIRLLMKMFYECFHDKKMIPTPPDEQLDLLFQEYGSDRSITADRNLEGKTIPKIHSTVPFVRYLERHQNIAILNLSGFKGEVHDVGPLADYLVTSNVSEVNGCKNIPEAEKILLKEAQNKNPNLYIEI